MAIDVVTSLADDGKAGTLRSVLAGASAGDEVTFSNSLANGTIDLVSSIDVAKPLTISGAIGGGQITLAGNGTFTDVVVVTNGAVTLDGLIITGGSGTGASHAGVAGGSAGGLLVIGGDVTLSHSSLTGNRAVGGTGDQGGIAAGGALAVGGSLTLQDDVISNNTAQGGLGTTGTGGVAVGGVYVPSGNLTVGDNVGYGSNSATGGSGPGGTGLSVTDFISGPGMPCFLAGTRIATPAGERLVETLKPGDVVKTLTGTAAIKWVGFRAYAAPFVSANRQLRPVCIAAGALGLNVPCRDLFVSPLHAMLIDGVLVPASALVDGVRITRSDMTEIRYHHIELDRHDVVLAEGAPAESFLDIDSRGMFQTSVGEPQDLIGCAPRIESGPVLDAIRARLAAPVTTRPLGPLHGWVDRVEVGIIEGWATDGSAVVELELVIDGLTVTRVSADRYRADLDRSGFADGRCAFRIEMPEIRPGRSISLRRVSDGARLAAPGVIAA